eukprot:gene37903-49675_t
MTNSAHRKPLPGTTLQYFDAREAVEQLQPGAWAALPYTARVHAENLVRRCDPATLTASLSQLIERKRDLDFPWFPARVVCHDILGQTALVDLAGLRDAIALQGGDPALVNPVVPTQLVVDHSLAVECGGFDPDAFEKNRAIEDRRNEDRFHFIDWTKRAFKNMEVIPPGNGIMHQINLERMSPVVHAQDGVAFPDTLVGTDSHTTMVNGLAVLGWGVGGIEAEAAMLGQPQPMVIPDVVGFKLTGKLKEGATATDLVLTVTQMLRKKGVVGKFVEFFGDALPNMTIEDQATIANMAPEYGAPCGFCPVSAATIGYLTATGRDKARVALVEAYAKAQGLWIDETSEDPIFSDVLELDISTVVPSLAGPKRPQDKVELTIAAPAFETALGDVFNRPTDAPRFPVAGEKFDLGDGDVVIAAITSCTNTSNPSVLIAAGLVAQKANKLGLKTKPWVKTSLAPGSQVVTDYLTAAGLQKELDALGFNLVGYGCTTCIGNSGPLDPAISQTINDNAIVATSVLSGNRNFEGRVNPDVQANYLASPPLVVAYAIAGSMRIDLATQPLGQDKKGKDVFLKDIWPTSKDIADLQRKSVTSESCGAASRAACSAACMFEAARDSGISGPSTWNSACAVSAASCRISKVLNA